MITTESSNVNTFLSSYNIDENMLKIINAKEDLIQEQVFLFLKEFHSDIVAYHVPNGGKRGKHEAYKFKKLGVLAGVSDIAIAKPMKGYCGAYIELKKIGGRLSDMQRDFLNSVKCYYFTAVCSGLIDSLISIDYYLTC